MIEDLTTAATGFGIAAAAVWSGWQSFRARKEARQAAGQTRAAQQAAQLAAGQTQAVHATLMTNNGGSHVKDALDRIEAEQAAARAEQAELRTDLREHMRDARAWERATEARLRVVERLSLTTD